MAMSREEAIFEKIREIIAGQLRLSTEDVRSDSLIVEELGADSIDIVEILTAFEDHYQITVSDEEIISFRTPEDILAYLEEHQT